VNREAAPDEVSREFLESISLVDGTTLADELRRRRGCGGAWPLDEALEIGACIAEGLAAVHTAGFVHRDIKPDNVMLPHDGKPAAKLTDFGVVRAVDATIRPCEDWAGSPRYMAPEALVPGVAIGPEADVYALCVTLYELLGGGRSPFGVDAHTHMAEEMFSHRRRAPIPLRVLGLGLPDAVVDVIHHGLAKKPHRRPSAAEIGRVLRRAQHGGAPALPGRPRRRTVLLLGLAAVAGALLGLAGGLLFAWLLLRP
jgi:serine/threonine-protein kinase